MKIEVPIHIVPHNEEYGAYIYVEVYVGMRKLKLLLDSGASETMLAETRVKKDRYIKSLMEQVSEDKLINLIGVTGTHTPDEQFIIKTDEFKIGGHSFSLEILIVAVEIFTLDGILGLDILLKHDAVIDLGAKKLILTV